MTFSAVTLFVALIPFLAVVMLGAPSLPGIVTNSAVMDAIAASLQAGAVAVAGWPVGVLAAFALWGARRLLRRVVLGSASVAMFIAIAQSVSGEELARPWETIIPPIAGGASAVLLVLTSTLNTMDPRIRQTIEVAGASPARAWLVVLASLRTTLTFAAAASFTLGVVLCARMFGNPTLAGLLWQATQHADVETAPLATLLALLSLPPLLLAGVLFTRRRLNPS